MEALRLRFGGHTASLPQHCLGQKQGAEEVQTPGEANNPPE